MRPASEGLSSVHQLLRDDKLCLVGLHGLKSVYSATDYSAHYTKYQQRSLEYET